MNAEERAEKALRAELVACGRSLGFSPGGAGVAVSRYLRRINGDAPSSPGPTRAQCEGGKP